MLTLGTFSLSAVSTAVALALSLGISPVPMHQLSLLFWAMHRFNPVLFILPIAFGYSSSRSLPRVVAVFSIILTTLYYTWQWFPWAHSQSTPVKAAYIVGALVLALPALMHHIIRGSSRLPRTSQCI